MDLGKVFMCHLRAPGKEIKNHTKIQARARTKKTEVAHLPVTWQRRRANVLKLCIYQLSDMIKVVNDTWRCFGWKLENFIPKTYFKKLKINLIPPPSPLSNYALLGERFKKGKKNNLFNYYHNLKSIYFENAFCLSIPVWMIPIQAAKNSIQYLLIHARVPSLWSEALTKLWQWPVPR